MLHVGGSQRSLDGGRTESGWSDEACFWTKMSPALLLEDRCGRGMAISRIWRLVTMLVNTITMKCKQDARMATRDDSYTRQFASKRPSRNGAN